MVAIFVLLSWHSLTADPTSIDLLTSVRSLVHAGRTLLTGKL